MAIYFLNLDRKNQKCNLTPNLLHQKIAFELLIMYFQYFFNFIISNKSPFTQYLDELLYRHHAYYAEIEFL